MKTTPIALLLLSSLTACASIIEGSTQQVNVQTYPPSQAQCTLQNSRGIWQATAPATVEIKRSKSDLNVQCATPQGMAQKTDYSGAEPWVFGNILIGGLIGLGVDAATGSMFAYEDTIQVPLQGANAASGQAYSPAYAPAQNWSEPVVEQPQAYAPEPAPSHQMAPANSTYTKPGLLPIPIRQ